MRSLQLLVLTALALPAAAGGSDWTFVGSTDGTNPKRRHEAGAVEVDGKFYLMGGRGARPVDRFDPVAETWTNLGNPPIQMHHFQPVEWGGKIYVICAFEGGYPNETPIPNIWIYDPANNTWTEDAAIPPARSRGAAGVVAYQDKLYIVGGNTLGHNGGYVAWTDCYDPATHTWTVLPDAPYARDHFTAAVIGNKIYAAGGRQTEQPNPFLNTIAPVDVFDLTAGTWSNTPDPLPTERAGTMVVARDQHLIVIGGETATQAHAECEALDVGTGEWLTLPALLDSRHSGGAVCYDDKAYVATGSGSNGGAPELNSQERLDLSGIFPATNASLLVNGDFDANLGDWVDAGDLSLSATGSIAAPALDLANGATYQDVAALEQTTYELTGVYRTLGASGAVTIELLFLDAGGIELGSRSSSPAPASDFTSFELIGTTPLGTTAVRVRAEAAGARTLRLDDLVFMERRAQFVRLGNPANPLALMPTASGPTIGQTWSPSIDHADFAPASTADFLGLGFLEWNIPTPNGTLLVGFGSTLFTFAAAPGAPLNVGLPNNAALIGAPLVAQGASLVLGVVQLTNALDLTIQAP